MSCGCGGKGLLEGYQKDFGSMLLRALGIQGDIPGGVNPVMSPGITVDDFTRPEYWWLRRGQSFGTAGGVGALAGNFSIIQLRAPTANVGRTNSIAVIEHVIVTNSNAAAQSYGIGLAVPTGGVGMGLCKTDSRQFSTVVPGGISTFFPETFQTPVAYAMFGQFVRIPPGESFVVPGTWILDSDQSSLCFAIQCQTVNQNCSASYQWRERPLLPQEL